jgi:hypothetical protein
MWEGGDFDFLSISERSQVNYPTLSQMARQEWVNAILETQEKVRQAPITFSKARFSGLRIAPLGGAAVYRCDLSADGFPRL